MNNEAIQKFNSSMEMAGCEAYISSGVDGVAILALGNIHIEEIRIPEGVKYIRRYINAKHVSNGVDNLKRVYIPDSVVDIGYMVFEAMEHLEEIIWAKGVQIIEERAFKGCIRLNKANFSMLKNIGKEAFSDCSKLMEADIGSVECISSRCFDWCTSLRSVKADNAVKIEKHAFNECEQLTLFQGKMVKEIGEDSFNGCKALESVDFIPKILGNRAFSNSGIKNIALDEAARIGKWAFYDSGLSGKIRLHNCEIDSKSFMNTKITEVDISGIFRYEDESFDEGVIINEIK